MSKLIKYNNPQFYDIAHAASIYLPSTNITAIWLVSMSLLLSGGKKCNFNEKFMHAVGSTNNSLFLQNLAHVCVLIIIFFVATEVWHNFGEPSIAMMNEIFWGPRKWNPALFVWPVKRIKFHNSVEKPFED